METIIQLIFVVALVKFCLKAALSGNLKVVAGYGVGLALYAVALYPVVINQPLTIISEMLSSRKIVSDMALLTTAESIIGILISIHLLDNYFRPKSKRTLWARFLKIVPGIIVLCAVCYFELLFFKWRVGGEFLTTSLMYAGILLVGVISTALFLRWALSSESLLLEVKLLLNLTIMVLGLLVSSSVAKYNISNDSTPIEWGALIAVLTGFAALSLLGIWLHKINFSFKITTLLKWNK